MTAYNREDYDVNRLGNIYQKDKTAFCVFAPTYGKLYLNLEGKLHEMKRNGLLFETEIEGDLESCRYHYETDDGTCFRDPFSFLSLKHDSIILDPEKFEKKTIVPEKSGATVIYEASVRDFSSADSFTGSYRSKFYGLAEEGLRIDDYYVIGLDYLKNLGISHLQLMPVFDFDNDKADYNWGYNPVSYNSVKADYVFAQKDPYAYINELRETVNILHENDIRVVLDVVFNHVYDRKRNDLQKMVPDLFFRFRKDGSYAQGTLCGNEIRSEEPFVADYFILMAKRYVELFDIDGLRFDLMGILDVGFMNRLQKELEEKKKDLIFYGEGWHMGDVLQDDLRASMNNAGRIKDIGMFNDYFRETIIHYVSGNSSIIEDVKKALSGQHIFMASSQSVNYVECHDGYTFYDRMNRYLKEDEWLNERRCRLALALVMVSRGIPFIHMGQEFLRTKKGIRNSYNSGDEINGIDWRLRVKNNADCDYFKQLVKIRKEHDFSMPMHFDESYGLLICRIDDLLIIVNPDSEETFYNDGNGHQVLLDGDGNGDYFTENIPISACCLVICKS